MKYLLVLDRATTGWDPHVPNLPGCIAVAETKDEVLRLIKEVIEFHLEGLRDDGDPVPEPRSDVDFVEVSAA